jgi:transcriptional regulator with XRE-family HTH domain
VEEVVVRTLEETPEGAAHWSKRELARRVGISPASVHRIWRAFGLQPWRTEDFKISPDPLLTGKIRDVVGLYLAPPANAVVFAAGEKPQIQAVERTAPVLPMIPGVPEPPLRLAVGNDAIAGIRASLDSRLAELDKSAQLAP